MSKYKLKITYDKDSNEISILGNEEGLKFLADVCLSVIGKDDPSGHFHFMEKMNNVEPGSINTTIIYSDED